MRTVKNFKIYNNVLYVDKVLIFKVINVYYVLIIKVVLDVIYKILINVNYVRVVIIWILKVIV